MSATFHAQVRLQGRLSSQKPSSLRRHAVVQVASAGMVTICMFTRMTVCAFHRFGQHFVLRLMHRLDADSRCKRAAAAAAGSPWGSKSGSRCGIVAPQARQATTTVHNASRRRLASMQVHYGETVKLVGSPAELGSWNVGAAPELTWSDGDMWTASVDLAPGDVHFKVRHHALLYPEFFSGCGQMTFKLRYPLLLHLLCSL
jgi:Starch binding domain